MSTSNQTYKALAIPHFETVFRLIDEVMIKHQIPYYLIGATAIALEYLERGQKVPRGTKDIDFAIMVSSLSQYEEIIKDLVDKGFRKAKAPWTLYFEKENIAIDILPYGEIEENDTVNFNERYSDLHVLGFKEVLENSKTIQVNEILAQIPSLEGIVILKLIAYSDRPEDRENDITDILDVISKYYDLEWDDITNKHFDLLDVEDLDELKVASEAMGRNCRVQIARNSILEKRILAIIDSELENITRSRVAIEWARTLDKDITYAADIIKHFRKGILHIN